MSAQRDLAWAESIVRTWRKQSADYLSWEDTKSNVAAVLKHCGGRTDEATACLLAYREEVRLATRDN